MSSETLRRAAALMRERAESTPMDTTLNRYDHGGGRLAIFTHPRELVADFYGDGGPREHYTSWPPAVALAVADWLDEAADHLEVGESDDLLNHVCPTALEGLECSVLGQALTVARAYLGETA